MADLTPEQKDRFLTDLESIVDDAEKLLRRARIRSKPGVASRRSSPELRGGLRATVRHARSTAARLDGGVGMQTKTLGSAIDDYARHEPWVVLGIAGGIGVLVGLMIGWRPWRE